MHRTQDDVVNRGNWVLLRKQYWCWPIGISSEKWHQQAMPSLGKSESLGLWEAGQCHLIPEAHKAGLETLNTSPKASLNHRSGRECGL